MSSASNADRSIPEALLTTARSHPRVVALVGDDRTWTYAELVHAVRAAAGELAALGVGAGDRVALWAENSADWVVACLATHFLGATVVPVSTRFTAAELQAVVERARPAALLATTTFLGRRYLDEAAGLALAGTTVAPISLATTATATPVDAPADDLLDAPSDVLFTSGTTGAPKGVISSHRQMTRAYGTWTSNLGLSSSDVYLCINPFSHSFGYRAGVVASVIAGSTLVPVASFDADGAFAAIERHRVSFLPGPPTLYQRLLELLGAGGTSHDISSLRAAVTGAAMIPEQLVRAMKNRLGFAHVATAYGMTETTGIVTMTRAEDPIDLVARTSGRAIDGVEVRIAGPDGSAAGVGEPGEILVRGFNVMLGYLDDPTDPVDADGWFRTGDVGTLDADGNLSITDRIKDLIVVGGFNVYPAEVERAILAFPGVGSCAVVGRPDEALGEVPVAYLVGEPGRSLDHAALADHVAAVVAKYKLPRAWTDLDEMPLNHSGKIDKKALRALGGAG